MNGATGEACPKTSKKPKNKSTIISGNNQSFFS